MWDYFKAKSISPINLNLIYCFVDDCISVFTKTQWYSVVYAKISKQINK